MVCFSGSDNLANHKLARQVNVGQRKEQKVGGYSRRICSIGFNKDKRVPWITVQQIVKADTYMQKWELSCRLKIEGGGNSPRLLLFSVQTEQKTRSFAYEHHYCVQHRGVR